MRLRNASRRRRGATLVESVLTTTAFLMLCVGAIDLGMGVYRQNVLTEAARQAARQAAVHGSNAKSTWNGGTWGPSSFGPTAASGSDPRAQAAANYLMGLNSTGVNVTMTWPDGDCDVGSRVSVTLTSTWTPIMGWVFGGSSVTLTASSQMLIAH